MLSQQRLSGRPSARVPAGHAPRTRPPCRRLHTTSAAVQEPVRAPAALKLNLSADTLLALPLSRDRVASLKQAVNTLQQTLADKAKAERPKRWPMMEWRVKDTDASEELEYLEIMCNPNACSSIFEAKALVTLRTRGGLKLTTEARIVTLQADVDAYLSAA